MKGFILVCGYWLKKTWQGNWIHSHGANTGKFLMQGRLLMSWGYWGTRSSSTSTPRSSAMSSCSSSKSSCLMVFAKWAAASWMLCWLRPLLKGPCERFCIVLPNKRQCWREERLMALRQSFHIACVLSGHIQQRKPPCSCDRAYISLKGNASSSATLD